MIAALVTQVVTEKLVTATTNWTVILSAHVNTTIDQALMLAYLATERRIFKLNLSISELLNQQAGHFGATFETVAKNLNHVARRSELRDEAISNNVSAIQSRIILTEENIAFAAHERERREHAGSNTRLQ